MKKNVYDLIGIGYGPSNLSLNICLREYLELKNNKEFKLKFFDNKKSFSWHQNMLLPNTYLQVSFLKDLATQRNPMSRYTFLNYLYENNRLDKFINLREFEPLRMEYQDYFKWASSHFEDDVQYGYSVERIEPIISEDGFVRNLKVIFKTSEKKKYEEFFAKNISIAVGQMPNYLGLKTKNEKIIHSSEFLNQINKVKSDVTAKIAIIGSGQSAVEMLLYIYNNYPNVDIECIFPEFTFSQSDSSIFVNELFHNENVDDYYLGNTYVRNCLFQKLTNYSAVDERELVELYKILHQQKFSERSRISITNFTKVNDIQVKDNETVLKLYNYKEEKEYFKKYDFIILGTGYIKNDFKFLKDIEVNLIKDSEDNFEINRDYSLQTRGNFSPKIFLIGHSEARHGLTNNLLSVNAIRSKEITNVILKRTEEKFKHA